MTISVTKIADNTVQITTSGLGNTLINLTNAVAAAMLGLNPVISTGWLLHDSFKSGMVFTQVFKALNVDAITYKYAILRWDTAHQELNTSCCEDWNATTHTPTNECYTFFNCAPIGYNLSACDLIIMVHPRWVNFTTFLNGEPSMWAGVFEMQREDPVDTGAAGFPCFGWISSNLWMIGASSNATKPLAGYDHTLISIPRTRVGLTGVNAAKGMAGDYGVTQIPHWLATSAVSMPYYLSNVSNKFAYSNWDTNRRLVLPIKPVIDYVGTVTNYGQIYGLKMLAPSGGNMNKIKLSVDSDGNFSNAGTLKDHWLLNVHHKPQANTISSMFANTSWIKIDVVASNGLRPEQLVIAGANYYLITQGGSKLVKISAFTTASTDIALQGSPTLYDLKYDGEEYVYITTSLGLTRLNVVDDSLTSLAISGGLQTLSLSTDTIVCASYGASATQTLYRIVKSPFALESGIEGDFTDGVAILSTFTEATARIIESVVDDKGNVYFAPVVATAANFKLIKISASGTISYLALAYVTWQVGLSLIDNSTLIVSQLQSATSVQNTQVNLPYFTAQATFALNVTSPGSIGIVPYKMTSIEINGVMFTLLRNTAANAFSCFAVSLGNTVTGSLNTGTTWADLTGGNMGNSNSACAFWSDGAKIISSMDSGIRIWTKINGEWNLPTVQLGQATLVA